MRGQRAEQRLQDCGGGVGDGPFISRGFSWLWWWLYNSLHLPKRIKRCAAKRGNFTECKWKGKLKT